MPGPYGHKIQAWSGEVSHWACDDQRCPAAKYWQECNTVGGWEAKEHTELTGHVTKVRYTTISKYEPRKVPETHGRVQPEG